MKIKDDHYNLLKARINNFLNEHPETQVKDALTNTRYRWSIYWAAGGFSNAQEYHYLNDANIDTALKSILHERVNR